MTGNAPPLHAFVAIVKSDLQGILDGLWGLGYHVIGPTVRDGAIVLDAVRQVTELPQGYVDEQDGGKYRLTTDDQAGFFDHVVGPQSLKQYLFPPREILLSATRSGEGWTFADRDPGTEPLAVIGLRGCDLHALEVQDRVFLAGPYGDSHYARRREGLFVVAVNCRRAAATCFCHSMRTGPAAGGQYDLALSELEDHFVVHVGSHRGAELLARVPWEAASAAEIRQSRRQTDRLRRAMEARAAEEAASDRPRPRWLDTRGIHDVLMNNLEHPRWEQVAERCLACANCTMVCPTCFCSSVEEVSDLLGDNVTRERQWASCFTSDHSYLSSGVVRNTIRARYRQWLTHKLATWIDQFGTSGCVGCGRCITWCPVGIDLTEEVAALRTNAGEGDDHEGDAA